MKTKQSKRMIHWRVNWVFVTYIPWSILVSCNGGVWILGTTSAIAYSQLYSLFMQGRRKKADCLKGSSNDAGREREEDWAGKIKFCVSEIGWEMANTVG